MFVVAIVQKKLWWPLQFFVVAIVHFFVVAIVQAVSPDVRDMPPPWAPIPSRKKIFGFFGILGGHVATWGVMEG